MTALNKQALTSESARESGNILLIVAARMARRELFTPLHFVSELPQKVVSMRVFREALERSEETLQREVCKIVDGHDRMAKKLKEAEEKLEAAEKRIAELEARSLNPAILDVISERQRQQSVEGWTPEHDNAYQNSELADAAACYAIHAHNQGFSTPAHWPWSPDWWKQSGARRDLVKAGALILAEIERIDRAAGIGVKGE
ncbi:hypothetical protein [Salmonella enterica]|uniref:hypothetical protein n=1 Tax=Salmonella enterica TaxID=28901 RepID=UPI001118A457|nr:hypothetical protein [Salmonella enterica]EDA7033181.1 hypothetical protein [Salmonella enterica subsp. enterica serovar Typhimurium]NYL70117.1 hypothetical protein [Salmonella enterica subsp. enterica serovar Typhimurium]